MADFWLDTDTFIRSKNEAYGFDLAPGFWKLIDQKAKEGIIASSITVYRELVKGKDYLAEWTRQRENSGLFVIPNKQVQDQNKLIVSYVNRTYAPHKVQTFLKGADPWMIAHAKVDGGEVVTFETRGGSEIKIPDIADEFHVRCINVWDLLRILRVSFDITNILNKVSK